MNAECTHALGGLAHRIALHKACSVDGPSGRVRRLEDTAGLDLQAMASLEYVVDFPLRAGGDGLTSKPPADLAVSGKMTEPPLVGLERLLAGGDGCEGPSAIDSGSDANTGDRSHDGKG